MDNTCFDVNFNIDVPTILCVIMRNNRSDKGHTSSNAWHNYTLLYTELFKKFKPKRIFELGLGSNNINIPSNMGSEGRPGASLYGWSEYFPDAKVYGADIPEAAKRLIFGQNLKRLLAPILQKKGVKI